jgi:hypothetical protein
MLLCTHKHTNSLQRNIDKQTACEAARKEETRKIKINQNRAGRKRLLTYTLLHKCDAFRISRLQAHIVVYRLLLPKNSSLVNFFLYHFTMLYISRDAFLRLSDSVACLKIAECAAKFGTMMKVKGEFLLSSGISERSRETPLKMRGFS